MSEALKSPESLPTPTPSEQPQIPQSQSEAEKPRVESFDKLGIDAGDTVTDAKGFQGKILEVEYDKGIPGGGKVTTEITKPSGETEQRSITMDRFLERQDTITSIEKPQNSDETMPPAEVEQGNPVPETSDIPKSTAESGNELEKPFEEQQVQPTQQPDTEKHESPETSIKEPAKEVSKNEPGQKEKTGHKKGSALEGRTREQITNEILEKRREQRYLKAGLEESKSLRLKARKMEETAESFHYAQAASTKKVHFGNADSLLRDFRSKLNRTSEMPYMKEHFSNAKLDQFSDLSIKTKEGKSLVFSEEPWKIRDSLRKFDDSLDNRSVQLRQELKQLEREAGL